MEAIIKFVYTGKIAFTNENAASLLKDADFFELNGVKDACMKFLRFNFDSSNIFETYRLGESLSGCNFLFEHSRTFIRQNLEIVSLTDDFVGLDFDLLENILSGMKDSYEYPEVMFEAIMRWVLKGDACRKYFLPQLLFYVNPSYLKTELLAKSLSKDEFQDIMDIDKCR